MYDTGHLEAGVAKYGSFEAYKNFGHGFKRPEKSSAGPGIVLVCMVVPWGIFVVTYYALSFSVRYWAPYLACAVAGLMFGCVLSMGWMTVTAAISKGGDALWLGLVCVLSLIGWTWAYSDASWNYHTFMRPYFDLSQQLNTYPSVDPSKATGNQYMDFGIINFVESASIDRTFSMAFKNGDTYCVAPIKVNNTSPASYDFWAVGINCCSSHLYDFRCGEYSNPAAHTGLKVVQDTLSGTFHPQSGDSLSFFRLAVKQASATFDIPALHPVFMEWVTEPSVTIDGYQESGIAAFIHAAFYFFCFEVIVLVLIALCYSK